MKIAFFTEGQYTGRIPRNNPNMRTDVAWICALAAVHYPINKIHELNETFDLGIVIIPKNKEILFDYPLIENMKKICKKIGTMQESTYWYWQGGTIQAQLWYHSILQSMDIIFCHNDMDLKYYRGITDVKCELMPTLMITDNIKQSDTKTDSAIIGGNFVSIYRGFDSYMVAREITNDIWAPTTGRMKAEEKGMDIKHLPWVMWNEWIYELSKHKYGVQLGTPSAGTFNLNCAYLGIPCIAYDNVNTQKYLHPNLSVPDGDIEQARKLATKLATNKDFYTECSIEAKNNFSKLYSEEKFLNYFKSLKIN